MKVLLIKDVYKLGRAGDVKKVADGYGRNYLIPQGLAVLATAGRNGRNMKVYDTFRNGPRYCDLNVGESMAAYVASVVANAAAMAPGGHGT